MADTNELSSVDLSCYKFSTSTEASKLILNSKFEKDNTEKLDWINKHIPDYKIKTVQFTNEGKSYTKYVLYALEKYILIYKLMF